MIVGEDRGPSLLTHDREVQMYKPDKVRPGDELLNTEELLERLPISKTTLNRWKYHADELDCPVENVPNMPIIKVDNTVMYCWRHVAEWISHFIVPSPLKNNEPSSPPSDG